jgi:hypothetical protein
MKEPSRCEIVSCGARQRGQVGGDPSKRGLEYARYRQIFVRLIELRGWCQFNKESVPTRFTVLTG